MILGRKAMTNLDSILKSRDITLLAKVRRVKAVVMYRCKLNHKEGWVLKNWCFQTVLQEKALESPLDCKEMKPVNPKGYQPWIFFGRTEAEAEAPILWPPDAKSWLTGKDPDAGKDWRQEEKGMTEDGLVGWHHWLDGPEFEQAPGVGDGQGSLVCSSPWGCKEWDMIKRLNWNGRILLLTDLLDTNQNVLLLFNATVYLFRSSLLNFNTN